jgi:hypothetical protein
MAQVLARALRSNHSVLTARDGGHGEERQEGEGDSLHFFLCGGKKKECGCESVETALQEAIDRLRSGLCCE